METRDNFVNFCIGGSTFNSRLSEVQNRGSLVQTHMHTVRGMKATWLTLWVDTLVEDKFAVSEKIEKWLKVVWTAVNEVSTSRVCCTGPT